MSDMTWIILGATSGLARAFVREVSGTGAGVLLCGRDVTDMEATAADALSRGAALAEVLPIDMRDAASFDATLDRAKGLSGEVNVAVFVGSMPDQADIDADPSLVAGTVTDSFTGPAQFLTALAPHLEERGRGTVIGVGSVAGDRGRLANYVYGSAKAGFHTYLAGLRNRLGRAGVHVMTVKPGPVDTAMTWGLDSLPFMTTPEAAARHMLKAAGKGRNVLYTASVWLLVMLVIRHIPEPIMKKLSI